MLVAQITDVHLGFAQGDPDELNRRRLDQVLRLLCAMTPRPDLLLMTGDLADVGDDDVSYARLREATAGLPFPVYFALGNHDDRAAFGRNFPETRSADGYVQYAIEGHALRILVLDTLEDGRHGGGFCETRAAWLRARLDEEPRRPTLVALHHPPVESGLSWMSENPDSAWMKRLEAAASGRSNIVAFVAGHLHRPMITRFAGTLLAVCAASAPELALDLGTIDPEAPDGRAMIVEEAPAFALHLWTGDRLLTHFATADDGPVLARWEAAMQPLVRHLLAERAAG
jgi:3',5'-cyclic AMP phosphodiesterase CpdA